MIYEMMNALNATEAQQNDPDYGVQNQSVLRSAWRALTGEVVE